ncbi:xanthine dehydrogenase family protein molybdopterin-binding subunit [bacterium SCSIO 12827]|nr:xanthine dehydrogenase family protein molybdopterin-binding subunit [bacterium SCSIO 12827]
MLPKIIEHLTPAVSVKTSRRAFLVASAAAAGAFIIGFGAAPAGAAMGAALSGAPAPFDAYLKIAADGKVTILSSQFDMGQGAYHGLATLVNEELGAAWDQITVEGATGDLSLYGNIVWGGAVQGTGGSSSMTTSFDRYRKAGAAARMMLVAAAAKDWDVPATEVDVKDGRLTHASGKSAGFGEMAAKAALLPVPKDVPLKDRQDWTLIGNGELRRYDSKAKTDGTHPFTIDVVLPGMLTAVMIHPPKFGAVVKSFEAAKAKAMKGVVDVVATPRGVAVVGEHMWAALAARDAVAVTWDEAKAETRGSAAILAEYEKRAAAKPQATARSDGDATKALAGAAKTVEATFRFPYLAHAAMEPLNAVARMNANGTLELWAGHQLPGLYQGIAAGIAGIKPEQVVLHIMKTGGGFGRRGTPDGDIVAEAVMVAKAIGYKAPVKVQWTRENDMRGGRYRPAYVHRLKAGIDAAGKLVAWDHHIVGQSIVAGTPFQGLIQNGIDQTSVEGASNLPYAVPNLRVGLTTTEVGVPPLWWRAVGSTHTAYATEVFLDQVAAAAGADPLAFRLAMLDRHPRHAAVLKLAAEKAGWGKPLAKGRFLGLAVHESFHTFVAHVAEVSIKDGAVKVHRAVAAVDCGTVVNPDVVKAQIEGGTGFGLGAILAEELTLAADGTVEQGNYDSYTPLRISAMPKVEVHIVASDAPPTGVGEPGVPSIGPAVANAVARGTGKWITTLPFTRGMQS